MIPPTWFFKLHECDYQQEKKKRDGALMSAKDVADLDEKLGTLFQDFQAKAQAFKQKATTRQNEEQNKSSTKRFRIF